MTGAQPVARRSAERYRFEHKDMDCYFSWILGRQAVCGSEAKVTLEQTRQTHERLPNPHKRLVILTKEVGGAAHCQVDNLELLNWVIFDWLDEVWRASE